MDYIKLNKRMWPIALLILVALGVVIHRQYMNEFPAFIHAWSQTDRYAIAVGFLNNDFDLLHPETLIYNKQFPHWWKHACETTITAVDLPLHEYGVALLMKLFGTTSPWVFRLSTFVVAMLGMFFLYKLAFKITNDWIKSLFVGIMALASPVYAYYFAGFIPGVPALSFAIAGLYFYLKHLDEGDRCKYFSISMALICVAVLMRMSFAILLVAVVCFELLRVWKKETTFGNKVPGVLIAVGAVVGYMAWNSHLRAMHDTVFLSGLMHADSWDETKELILQAKNNWFYQYFSERQYKIFLVLVAFVFLFGKVFRGRKTDRRNKSLPLWLFWVIYVFGCILFLFAMAKQAPDHDYYFIDTFFLPCLMLLIFVLNGLNNVSSIKGAIIFLMLIGITAEDVLIEDVNKNLKDRRDYTDRAYITSQNFEGSETFLDSVGVPKDAKILALYAYPQNAPFILMNRKGYTEMWYDYDIVEKGLEEFDYDYVVIENIRYEKEYEYHKQFLGRLVRIADNDKVSLCRYADTIVCNSVEEFFEDK